MKDNENSIYVVDLETKELLVATMNFMEMFADAQVDQESEHELRQINCELGAKFGLIRTEIQSIEGEDADGNPTVTFKANSDPAVWESNETEAPALPGEVKHLRLVKDADSKSTNDNNILDDPTLQ
jgi:hypothetical protein|tara:strand:+ start:28906 stop:29283 length:378 start_codon:yes stop_codon:yes gene_type:complete